MTQEYLGQVQISTSTDSFAVDNGTSYPATLTTGKYFPWGYDGEATDQLAEHLQTTIRALNAAFDTGGANECAVTHSAGKLEISFDSGGGNVSITWTDAALGTLLGFSGNLSGAYAYQGVTDPKGVWTPSRNPSDYPQLLADWWGKRSSSKVTISRDGSSYGWAGQILYEGVYTYENLTDDEMIGDTYGTFESFWENVIHEVLPVRVVIDDTSYASTSDYVTGFILPADAQTDGEPTTIGHFRELTNPTVDNYRGLWDLNFKMAKYVVAS